MWYPYWWLYLLTSSQKHNFKVALSMVYCLSIRMVYYIFYCLNESTSTSTARKSIRTCSLTTLQAAMLHRYYLISVHRLHNSIISSKLKWLRLFNKHLTLWSPLHFTPTLHASSKALGPRANLSSYKCVPAIVGKILTYRNMKAQGSATDMRSFDNLRGICRPTYKLSSRFCLQ